MSNNKQNPNNELKYVDGGLNYPAILLVLTVSFFYLISQFLRNSVGVITVELTADFNTSAYELGLLSGVFFFGFASVQIPLGVMIDKYGPKRSMLTLTLIAVSGCILFAYANATEHLIFGRILMGLGCSSFLMAPFVLFSNWFKAENFSFFASIIIGVGTLGALLATAPLSFSVEMMGWRNSFILLGSITFIGIFLIYFFIHDLPKGKQEIKHDKENLVQAFKGVGRVIKNREVLKIFPMFLFSYSSFATILGLWGGPFLSDIYQADIQELGNILLIIALAHFISLFTFGNIDRRVNSRKKPVMVGMVSSAICVLALAVMAGSNIIFIYIIFAAFGLSCGYFPILSAHGRSIFSDKMAGRGITFLNIGSMGGTFLLQYLTGLIMNYFEGWVGFEPLFAYQANFIFIVLMMCIGIISYIFVSDIKPYKDHEDQAVLAEH